MSISVKITPILLKHNIFDPTKYKTAIENSGNGSAKAVEVDFHVTTQTWTNKPKFDIKHTANSGEWIIKTDDEIYGYVNSGTRPHIILPRKAGGRLRFFRTGFRPKSRVGWIGSNKGNSASKDETFAKSVHHPGTQARNFAKIIRIKWDKEWPRQLQRAIQAAAAYNKT